MIIVGLVDWYSEIGKRSQNNERTTAERVCGGEGEMTEKINIQGQRFGRLVAIKDSGKRYQGEVIWLCFCSCGNFTQVRSGHLKSGTTQSCGCYMRERGREANYKHGGRGTRLYRIYCNMIQRCENPNKYSYRYYGKKGIKISPEWRNDYMAFKEWALANGYQDNLTIDRIDSKGGYNPSNCRWITHSENTTKANLERWAGVEG